MAYVHLSGKSFRLAQEADAYVIDGIRRSSNQTSSLNSNTWEIDTSSTVKSVSLSIQQTLTNSNHFCFVCCSHNQVVGYSLFKPITKSPFCLELQITIHDSFQSTGWGTYLLKSSIQYLTENTVIKKLALIVEKENKKAIGLYNKVGFKTVKKQDHTKNLYLIMSKSLAL